VTARGPEGSRVPVEVPPEGSTPLRESGGDPRPPPAPAQAVQGVVPPQRPRDGVPENRHPLNLLRATAPLPPPSRLPIYEVYMRMAEELAKRSTCARLQVGTVITDRHLENVVAIGYNGNARGLPNRCDDPGTAGRCGCIHSEMNALVKAQGRLRDKVAFVTASPCVMCAKLMVQARVAWVFYREAYRDPAGLDLLRTAGVGVVEYNLWREGWRGRQGTVSPG
jgi:dCMP deaminase